MKFRYAVKRFFKSNNKYILILILALAIVIVGASYAMFTSTVESKGSLNIVTGNLYTKLSSSDLDSDNEIVIAPAEEKTITINLKNINSVSAKYNLYYTVNKEVYDITIGYLGSSSVKPVPEGFIIEAGQTKNVKVKVTNNGEENVTIKFGSNVGLSTATLPFPTGKLALSVIAGRYNNPNITSVYRYVAPTNIVKDGSTVTSYNGCVTGEEEECEEIDLAPSDTVETGTIIKYRVNNSEEKYFYVLYDNGDTLMLQQRENTIENTQWYAPSVNNGLAI